MTKQEKNHHEDKKQEESSSRPKLSFLQKQLIKILEAGEEEGIKWRDDGLGFTMHNPNIFCNKTLKIRFPKWSLPKFRKQLRSFYFQQDVIERPFRTYKNDKFRRDNPYQCIRSRFYDDFFQSTRSMKNKQKNSQQDQIKQINSEFTNKKPTKLLKQPQIDFNGSEKLQKEVSSDQEALQLFNAYDENLNTENQHKQEPFPKQTDYKIQKNSRQQISSKKREKKEKQKNDDKNQKVLPRIGNQQKKKSRKNLFDYFSFHKKKQTNQDSEEKI